jgi:hypothetical protein
MSFDRYTVWDTRGVVKETCKSISMGMLLEAAAESFIDIQNSFLTREHKTRMISNLSAQ